jgi:hypothetical protein
MDGQAWEPDLLEGMEMARLGSLTCGGVIQSSVEIRAGGFLEANVVCSGTWPAGGKRWSGMEIWPTVKNNVW